MKRSIGDTVILGDGYRMIGDYLLRESKIEAIKMKLEGQSELTLSQAIRIIESCGTESNPEDIIQSLGYTILWEGLDYERSMLKVGYSLE